jgi:hypothetical protein
VTEDDKAYLKELLNYNEDNLAEFTKEAARAPAPKKWAKKDKANTTISLPVGDVAKLTRIFHKNTGALNAILVRGQNKKFMYI